MPTLTCSVMGGIRYSVFGIRVCVGAQAMDLVMKIACIELLNAAVIHSSPHSGAVVYRTRTCLK